MHRYKRQLPPSEKAFQEIKLERRKFIESNLKLDKRLYIPDVLPPDLPRDEDKRAYWRSNHTITSPSTYRGAKPNLALEGHITIEGVAAAETTVRASGSNDNGFSEIAIQALQEGTLTNSDSDLIQGGLDYIIEANDIGYLCEIQIGTPAQTFLMLMDTGSADTWVPSTTCGLQACGDHTALGADNSQTFQASEQQFQVTYGSGAVAGVLATDTITIAGMTLENHALGVALQESIQFSGNDVPFDGLVGLALGKLSNQGVSTPIESLASTGLIKSPILGIALGRFTDGENNGELVFGQADTSKFDASTTQSLRVTSDDGFWQIDMAAVNVDGVEVVQGRQAILDTGTSLIIAPPADAAAFHAQIDGAIDVGGGMFSIPCTINQEITMTFGKIAFQIDVRDLLFQPLSNDLKGNCLSSISSGLIKDDLTWLLGDSFLKNVYMITNSNDLTIQLSSKTDIKGIPPPPTSLTTTVQMGLSTNTSNDNSTDSTINTTANQSNFSSSTVNRTTYLNSATFSIISALAALLAGEKYF
nr:endopeptidase [Kwoniella pini CBS 10737]OCF53642.1 endopeptidase [Kwoniella pini CBS 10737]